MVLTLRRAAFIAALLCAETSAAQRGAGAGGVARGSVVPGGGGRASVGRRPVLYGFALECVGCEPLLFSRGRGSDQTPALDWSYSYTSYPHVAAVLPGSGAEVAGIQVGDVLVAIDGVSLLTIDGTKKFASATSGDSVHLSFDRGSKTIDVPLVLGRPAGGRGGRGGTMMTLDALSARYAGAYGNVDLDVWSDEPVFVTRDSTGAMILRTGTTVFRLRTDLADSTSVGRGRAGAGGRSGGQRTGRGGRVTPPAYQ